MNTTSKQGAARTLYQKLVESHTVRVLDEQNVLLFCDLHLMNEYTSPQAFAGLDVRKVKTLMPGQNVSVVSHIIPTHPVKIRVIDDQASALQASNLAQNCARHGIPLFDTNDAMQGIEHVVAPEHGMIRPGMVVICGDSHTTTYGALAPWVSASAPPRWSTCWRRRPWSTASPGTCAYASTANCQQALPART